MNNLQVIMALPMESQNVFESKGITVHYCGIGKINAAMKATELILKGADGILNLGTAGSHHFETHSLIQCGSFVQRDMDLSPLGFPRGKTPMDEISDEIKIQTHDLNSNDFPMRWGVCGTGDAFEVEVPKVTCQLVDMEGYAIAKACIKLGVPFYSYKYITDGSDENAHNDWVENLKVSSVKLFECYQKFMYFLKSV